MSTVRVLVVDDDPHLREVVVYALQRQGWITEEAADGAAALALHAERPVDLLVLDVLMPGLDGLETVRRLRASSQVPVLFLSSRAEEVDRILGLELGGDDYLAKPFSPRELVTRCKAILRRTRPAEAPATATITVGPLVIDPEAFRVTAHGTEVPLTATELRLLEALARHPDRVYERDELVARAYPDARHVSDRTVDSHIRHVRAKLREAGVEAIQTVHGVGYRLGRP